MLWIKDQEQKKHHKNNQCKIVTSSTAGIFLLVLIALSIILDPISLAIRYGTAVKPGSFIFSIFQSEISGTRLSLYVFNITNSQRFLSGQDYKLKVQEVGPFTYVESRHNSDIDMDEAAEELWFTANMGLQFLPDESIGDPELMQVTVPNLAFLSATSLLRKYPVLFRQGFGILARRFGSRVITTLDASSFLWGYKDPMISLANRVAPGLIYFDRLGIIDRLYDNNTFYRLRMSVKHEDKFSVKQLHRYLRSKPMDQQDPLESYNFTDTYEGASFPPGLTRETPLNVYRTGVCRVLNLEYEREMTLDYGPTAWVYRISNETFSRDCGFGVCGMLDLANCTFGIPIALSRTHFLNTDPKIYERIEGMHPDPLKHDSMFVLESKMGFELDTSLSLQMNMVMGDISFNREAKAFSNMTVPVAYIQVKQQEVFDEFKTLLRWVYIYGPYIILAIQIVLFIVSAALLFHAVRLYKRRWSDDDNFIASGFNEKQMPLMS